MRKEPLLTAVPPAPVQSLSELYAIAFDWRKAPRSAMAPSQNKRPKPLADGRRIEVLATRERERADSLSAACLALRQTS